VPSLSRWFLMAQSGPSWPEIIGVLLGGGAIGAAAKWFHEYLKQRDTSQSKWYTEFQNTISGLHHQLAMERQESAEQIGLLDAKWESKNKSITQDLDRFRRAHMICQSENAELRAEIRLFRLADQQRAGRVGLMARHWTDGYIVADAQGIIRDVNPGLTILLHWREEELIGEPLDRIMPERYRAAHSDKMKKVREENHPPQPDQVHRFHALTREGAEIPVDVQLTWWTADGQWWFGATMRRRFDPPPTGLSDDAIPTAIIDDDSGRHAVPLPAPTKPSVPPEAKPK
jgi:PAS domain S-box-containing protein